SNPLERVRGGGEAASMTLIANVVTLIQGGAAPVVFLDTCVLLDVVRAPRRNKPNEVRVARQFLASVSKNPKTLHILAGEPTQTEWNDHIDETETECNAAVESCNAVVSICGHMAIPLVPALPAAILSLPAQLRQLSADLLASALPLDYEMAAMTRAMDRVV